MYKDIFEILKHDNHKLEIVKDRNALKLGCTHCGKTIISSDMHSLNDIQDLYSTLKDNSSLYCNIKGYIREYIIQLLLGDVDNFKEFLRNNLDTVNAGYSLYSYPILPLVGTKTYTISRKNAKKTIDYFDIPSGRFEELSNKFRDKLIDIATDMNFIVKDVNEEPLVISNEVYEINGTPFERLYVTNKDFISEKEEEHPTVKDVYVFKDMDDYLDKHPCWDDIDAWNQKAIEFYYRSKNNLYDYSNLNKVDMLKNFLSYTEGYESLEIYSSVISDAFNIKEE